MKKLNNVSEMNTPQIKTPGLKVLVVSTEDKENATPEVFLDQPRGFNFSESTITLSVPALDENAIRPYMEELAKIKLRFDPDENDEELEKERMDSVSTLESLEPTPSRITTQNRQRGFQIPAEQQSRVLSDITSLYSAKEESTGPSSVQSRDSLFGRQQFGSPLEPQGQYRSTFDFKQLVDKENSKKNELRTPFQMKRMSKNGYSRRRTSMLGVNNRNVRRGRGSMRL